MRFFRVNDICEVYLAGGKKTVVCDEDTLGGGLSHMTVVCSSDVNQR